VRPLAANRQALAVAEAPEATEVHEALDVHADLTPQIALDLQLALLDHLADATGLVVVELVSPLAERDVRRLQDLARKRLANSVDVSERDFHPLVAGKIDACQTRHA
jgi:hypothetical protein